MQPGDLVIPVYEFVLLLFSLSLHECAHAWTASRLGDQTARMQGRVTLNPMSHIDPVGTLIFPAIIIFGPLIGFSFFSGLIVGWAKPTPITTRNFHKIVRDDNLTTLAGPASNLLLVFLAILVLVLYWVAVPGGALLVYATLRGGVGLNTPFGLQAPVVLARFAIEINLALFFFNLLPIPPLDGSRLLRNLLPYNAVQAYDRIPYWVSLLFMVVFGAFIVHLLLDPSLNLVFWPFLRLNP